MAKKKAILVEGGSALHVEHGVVTTREKINRGIWWVVWEQDGHREERYAFAGDLTPIPTPLGG